ncbi:RNA-binding RNA annealing protein [Ophidiomyces ophidiicola]|nr:RNA-binding RNA annealing protein [Ophidiomyces ophidiicola]KAI2149715.1 RNA-binding RNA annealing protein [Ophidiomyces ophidiicola]KAI2405496.1 RNA-binding RNA annealing protein [Ophidiomyces ophidiicola]
MAGKLDTSLDEIINTTRARRQRRRETRVKAAPAPVGGVRKSTRQVKPVSKAIPTAPSPASDESKIIVSGLPSDVNEANIKEYFHQSAGPVKKVMVTYNQNGTSRGIAAITFARPETAAKAAKELNGLLIDKRPIKIEVVVDAARAPAVPPVRPLGERVAQPKSQPKPAAAAKAGRRDARGRTRRGRNASRPKPKSAAELDAEMADYFVDATANGTAAGAGNSAPAAATEDMGMDEISVRRPTFVGELDTD